MKRRSLILLALTPMALFASGCSTAESSTPARASSQPTSLVAGDSLGHVVFADATRTASAPKAHRPTFAEVPSR